MSYPRLVALRDRLDAVGFPTQPVLRRLFADGLRVRADDVRDLLTKSFDDAIALGLIAVEGESVVVPYRIVKPGGVVLVLEPAEPDGFAVMPPSGSSDTLVRAMRREPCETALDLGCGCGILALHLAGHSTTVLATDCNPRATALTTLSAGLNHHSNVSTHVGTWFDGLEQRRFDQIVCNPPFVISPRTDCIYRDGGQIGDAISRGVVRALPRHLTPGGVGQVLVNWVVGDPLDSWTAFPECDVHMEKLATYAAEDYARHWLGDDADGPEFGRWMDYYHRLGIGAIGAGVVTLVRHS